MPTIAVIDYDMGNLHSACKGLEFAGATPIVTDQPEVIHGADGVVLPGVGAFDPAMQHLRDLNLTQPIRDVIASGKPFLGICVGMQMMTDWGREYEDVTGFGWVPGEVTKIAPSDPAMKVPHMGWNDLVIDQPHPVLDGISTGDHAYFVHSYHLQATNEADVITRADYGGPVTAIVGRDNLIGTQFHPEKSQTLGLALIGNF
ncbi:imidazole glycerol phosphate synthase subunit HisH, partial [Leptolyngbya cf. ectocarpi LEGE 11479]